MKKLLVLIACVFAAFLNSANAQVLTLQPLTTFGTNGDGSIWPGQPTATSAYAFTSDGAERAIAYNPVSGHLLVVCRTNFFSPIDYHIYVLDGATGTNILDVNSQPVQLDISSDTLTGGNASFTFNMIGVADDGSIYVGNLSNAANPPQFNLYYWASETSPQTAVYFGNPGAPAQATVNERWGDTFAVRGAGTSTQVLIASRGTMMAILRPPVSGAPDAFANPFTATALQTDIPVSVGMGFGLCFGAGNTIYSKAASSTGSPLVLLNFNLNAGTATTVTNFALTDFPGRTGAINTLIGSNLLVGLEVVAGNDLVRLYDISNATNPPVELDRQQFTTNAANLLFAGSVAFGTNGRVYVLDTDNGIRVFTLTSLATNPLAPTFTMQPTNINVIPNQLGVLPTNVAFVTATDGTQPISYQWFQGTTAASTPNLIAGATNLVYNFPNPTTNDNGKTFSIVASNIYGSPVTSSIVAMGVTTNIPVSLPAYEPYNYPVGTLGTNGGWYVQSGASGNIAAGNLSVPWLPTSFGNMFSWLNGTMSYRLPFGIYSSGSVFYSIILQIPSLAGFNAPPGVLCGLANGTGTQFMKLNMNTNGLGQYFLGCSIAGAAPTYDTNLYNPGDTVFIVERYTFTGTSTDTATLWLNPSPATFGADNPPAPTVTQSANALASIDRFFFRHSGGNQPSSCFADELRIGLSWAAVTPQASPALNIASDGTNASLSWPTLTAGYGLRATANIAPPSVWQNITNAVNVVGTNNVVTVKQTNQPRFFQLIK